MANYNHKTLKTFLPLRIIQFLSFQHTRDNIFSYKRNRIYRPQPFDKKQNENCFFDNIFNVTRCIGFSN
jgi:hypothetical protein